MKKIASIILVIACLLSFAACGSSEPESNRLDTTSADIAKNLPDKLELDDLDCLTEKDSTAENLLVFIYGIDESLIEKIDSYFITNSHRSTDARAIAVIFFKDSETVKEDISSAESAIRDIYLKNLVNTTATYDAEQSKIAGAANFKLYDNALAFASYDTNGNSAVFDAIEGK
jgi:hypothetical protein